MSEAEHWTGRVKTTLAEAREGVFDNPPAAMALLIRAMELLMTVLDQTQLQSETTFREMHARHSLGGRSSAATPGPAATPSPLLGVSPDSDHGLLATMEKTTAFFRSIGFTEDTTVMSVDSSTLVLTSVLRTDSGSRLGEPSGETGSPAPRAEWLKYNRDVINDALAIQREHEIDVRVGPRRDTSATASLVMPSASYGS